MTVVRESDPVDVPDAGLPERPPPRRPKKKRGKRRTTDAMRKANRINSSKSTGPKSDASKAAVATHAVKHGCCCKTLLFLDDEDPRLFWAEVDRRCIERGVATTDERTLVTAAVYAELTKVRSANALTASINEVRAQTRDAFSDGTVKHVRAWIPRLEKEADIAVEELRSSTSGCTYLLNQLQFLRERLQGYYSLEVLQRSEALRLGGNRPEEIFKNRDVFDLNKAYLGGINGTNGFNSDGATNALQYDLPDGMTLTEFTRRCEPLVKDLPTVEEGNRRLKAYVEREIASLTERKKVVALREQRQLQANLEMAQAPVDKAGALWRRYMDSSDRTYNASLRLLLSLQNDRRKHGDEYGTVDGPAASAGEPSAVDATPDEPDVQAPAPASEGAISPVGEASPAAENRVQTVEKQNKAVAPQVVGGSGGCNEVLPPSGDRPEVPDGGLPVNFAELLAEARRKTDAMLNSE